MTENKKKTKAGKKAKAEKPARAGKPAKTDNGVMGGYSILVLDGDGDTAALLKAGLESAGLGRVDMFTDPEEAMAAFRNKKYHIVLADMDVSLTDGAEMLEQVKRYDPMAQVIATTGQSTVDRALACLELGVNDYVLKPFASMESMVDIVRDSIGKLERWKEAIRETVLKESEMPV